LRLSTAWIRSDAIPQVNIFHLQSIFRENDILYLLRSIMQVEPLKEHFIRRHHKRLDFVSFHAAAVKDREELLTRLQTVAKKKDCILVMGARDPSLPSFVRKIISLLSDKVVFVNLQLLQKRRRHYNNNCCNTIHSITYLLK
jgi:hypothetical protein